MKLIIFICIATFLTCGSNGCDTSVLDLVLVLDESGSVGLSNYNLTKDALIKMITNLNVNPNKVHVGLVRYSSTSTTVRSLIASDQDKQELLRYVTNMEYMGGGTATGDALNSAKYLFSRFGRSTTPRICVVFTDGHSNTGSNVNIAADALKSEKVHIFAIGIGSIGSIGDSELSYIASEPKSRYKLLLQDYSGLVSAINSITNTACEATAFIEFGQKAVVETVKNELRNFESDISKLRTNYIELAVNNIKGCSRVSYSFDDPKTVLVVKEVREEYNELGQKVLFYDIPVPSQAKRFYFSMKSICDGENKYELQLNK